MTVTPASAHAPNVLSRTFRNAFLKLMAVSAGLVIGVGIIALTGYWLLHRPKTWNTNAVSATFKRLAIYENHEKPTEPHYYVNVFFDVTNNTDSDYVLPIEAWQDHLMEMQSGVLLGSSGWEFSLSQATMPYKVPSGFFDPKPILIPAHATVEVRVVHDSAYAIDAVKGKTKEQVIENQLRQTDDLVIFDDATHYRINFPIKGIWGKRSSKTAPEQTRISARLERGDRSCFVFRWSGWRNSTAFLLAWQISRNRRLGLRRRTME